MAYGRLYVITHIFSTFLYGKVKEVNQIYICTLHYTIPLLLGLMIDWKIDNSYRL